MGTLEIGLIFLIVLLSIFFTITGLQVFYILRDLKKALDRLNKFLDLDRIIPLEAETLDKKRDEDGKVSKSNRKASRSVRKFFRK